MTVDDVASVVVVEMGESVVAGSDGCFMVDDVGMTIEVEELGEDDIVGLVGSSMFVLDEGAEVLVMVVMTQGWIGWVGFRWHRCWACPGGCVGKATAVTASSSTRAVATANTRRMVG